MVLHIGCCPDTVMSPSMVTVFDKTNSRHVQWQKFPWNRLIFLVQLLWSPRSSYGQFAHLQSLSPCHGKPLTYIHFGIRVTCMKFLYSMDIFCCQGKFTKNSACQSVYVTAGKGNSNPLWG